MSELVTPRVEVLFPKEEIRTAIGKVALDFIERYETTIDDTKFISLLNGSIPFTNALMHEVAAASNGEIQPQVFYIGTGTYGHGREAGKPILTKQLTKEECEAIRDKTAVVIDDTLDTARTLSLVRRYLLHPPVGASDLETIVLVEKDGADTEERKVIPHANLAALHAKYSEWLFGMGLNGDPRSNNPEAGRWLEDIYRVIE